MNKHIVIAAFVIAGVGVVHAWVTNKPVTPVIMGSYIFILVLSLADLLGGPVSSLSGGIAMVAVVYVLLHELPDTIQTANPGLWSQLTKPFQPNVTTSGAITLQLPRQQNG